MGHGDYIGRHGRKGAQMSTVDAALNGVFCLVMIVGFIVCTYRKED